MLRKVTVEAAFYTVNSGVVVLVGEQAKARMHNLKAVKVDKKTGDGEYEIVNPIQFKRGESFGFSGETSKNGVLSDPEAEELRRMEQAETVEQAVKVAVAAEREALRKEYAEKAKGLEAAIEAKVRAELEPKIRSELMKEIAKPGITPAPGA